MTTERPMFLCTTILLSAIVLTGCATNSQGSDFPEIEPKTSREYYLDQRSSYYNQKNKSLSSEEARAKAQADYNLYSDPVTGTVR